MAEVTDSAGRPVAPASTSGSTPDGTTTVCLIVQLDEATTDEYRMLVDALKSALVPLGWSHRMALHASIKESAQAVLDAYHGTALR